uniref:Uncharacterized protein n=1 Tax=Chenopodium quinoa TaxID=63459 RepID=A0A803M795_CHEQI
MKKHLKNLGGFHEDDDETEHANLSCIIPKATDRGFIEVEDHGLNNSFFPFIVAEKDICSEIQTLENILERFKWLMDFSMDHDWCANVKKLLDILFAGSVGSGEHSSLKVALSEMGILHRAVRRNSRPMVEFLLRYAPLNVSEEFISSNDGSQVRMESMHGRMLAIEQGLHLRIMLVCGATMHAYIHIVQRKIYRSSTLGHVVVDIPGKQSVAPRQDGAVSFEVGRSASLAFNQSCKLCDQKMSVYYGSRSRASLVYRPTMLSMVGIAAVCMCGSSFQEHA